MDTFIILAGGKSTRIGTNKAFLNINNDFFIQILINKIINLGKNIIIVTNNINLYSFIQNNKIQIIQDIQPDKGVLMGLYTGLEYSKTDYNFVISCDIPFFKPNLGQYLWNLKDGYDVIIPKLSTGLEPLHAIYSKNCIKAIKKSLAENKSRLISFHADVMVRYVQENEILTLDPQLISFFNINTMSDYQKAQELGKTEEIL